MNVLTADDFLDAPDLDIVPVPLPGKYGEDAGLCVRNLTGDDRSEIERQFAGRDAKQDPRNFRAAVLLRCICDAEGKQLFGEQHRDRLMGKAAGPLETLFEVACRINGFTKKDVEELEKNSPAGRKSDCSSGCASPGSAAAPTRPSSDAD